MSLSKTTPATPQEAELLAIKAVNDYLAACRTNSSDPNYGNYLMKLCSVAGVTIANKEGYSTAAQRLEGTALFLLGQAPQGHTQ
ncbi:MULTISPECIES: hypothetical protein [Comamonas]|uniref:hypothetical protein n=1 Tax=Comamonas TaxID=283 RepID=UPI0025795BF0|nr:MULTISPECIES: hypothetical protein [Comamonas]